MKGKIHYLVLFSSIACQEEREILSNQTAQTSIVACYSISLLPEAKPKLMLFCMTFSISHIIVEELKLTLSEKLSHFKVY